jgi:macrolide-specific efflux system membrane fusion protein
LKKIVWGAVAFGVAAIAVTVSASMRTTRAGDDFGSAQVVRVVRRNIGSVVKATGVIKPRVGAEVRVGSRISGVVKRLYVRIGDAVAKGQLLAQLDGRDLVARRDEAAAALQQAEVTLSYAKLDLQRKRALSTAGSMAPSDLELAERAYAIGAQLVSGARASLAYANTQVEYARIVAPITGVVASVSTQEGETVAASFAAPTFLTLLDPSRLEVWAYVDETDIGRIRIGQNAQFTVDTYGDHPFGGQVTAVYPKAEIRDNVVNYVSVVTFTPPRDRTLRPEMTTAVRIDLDMRAGVLVVPIRAVRREGARTFVLLRHGGTVERRQVTTGIRDDSYVEIVSGLREGDEVLVGDTKTPRGDAATE